MTTRINDYINNRSFLGAAKCIVDEMTAMEGISGGQRIEAISLIREALLKAHKAGTRDAEQSKEVTTVIVNGVKYIREDK